MMKKFIIIDGNNLIHKLPDLKNLFYSNPEAAQLALYERVKSRKSKVGKIVLVFDGFGSGKSDIIYSGKLTADEIIRRFIEDNYEKNSVAVVSSDNYIISLAKACGCEIIKSDTFLKSDKGEKKKVLGSSEIYGNEKPEHPTKREIDEFKKLFS